MEKGHDDCFDEAEELEERLAAELARNSVFERRRAVKAGELYRGVEDYDPVLRSHCRLEEDGEDPLASR